jgi:hypothetical protein
LDPVVEGLLLGVDTGKSGKKSWVNVQDAVSPVANKTWAKKPHVPGAENPLHAMLFEDLRDSLFVNLSAGMRTCRHPFAWNAGVTCSLQTKGAFFVGDDHGDARGKFGLSTSIDQRLEVASRS